VITRLLPLRGLGGDFMPPHQETRNLISADAIKRMRKGGDNQHRAQRSDG
jgi:hypothetical protein